ncbi:MAG TPA: TMEM165/GDT1 family protein [Thermoplasmata archaeon]|nr:TMEM165/GDT1 family protein [Thermoplasmata archaeon]
MDLAWVGGFAVVFAVIGFLEVFDRTSFALIALAARSHPFRSWVGGASAFVLTSTLSVTVGSALSDVLGPSRIGLLRVAGGAFLIAYAAWLYFHPESEEAGREPRTPHTALVTAFVTIFLLELGDTTMIFQIIFVADFGWLIVLVAGALALVTVAAWDCYLGAHLGTRVEPKLLHRVVVAVLTIVGAVTIAYGLAPSAFPTLGLLGPV